MKCLQCKEAISEEKIKRSHVPVKYCSPRCSDMYYTRTPKGQARLHSIKVAAYRKSARGQIYRKTVRQGLSLTVDEIEKLVDEKIKKAGYAL